MKIELVINTADADALGALREQTAQLRDAGHEVRARLTFESGDGSRFASEAVRCGADLVIAAGGDGTLNEVVNGLLSAGKEVGADSIARLGLVPLGTANDFANYFGLTDDVAECVATAVHGAETLIDVAAVNGRYFINVSSGGIGAEATEDASDRSKRLLGSLAYVATGIRKFASLAPMHGRFTAAGEVLFDGQFLFFAVGNGGRTGGGVWVTPQADVTDGLLDLCIVENLDHGEFLRLLPDIRAGRHVDNEHVIYRRVSALTVEPSGDLSVNVDGEPIRGSVLEYSVYPAALRVAGGPADPYDPAEGL